MLVKKSATPLLILLAAAAAAANAAAVGLPAATPAVPTLNTAAAAAAPLLIPPAANVNDKPGSADAPVDGLDGKPHTGPGLFETKEKGKGKVGISGGAPHVDLKNPPPHTGGHEIVDVEGKAEDVTKVCCAQPVRSRELTTDS